MKDYLLGENDLDLIIEALQLLLDYKNHGICKNEDIINLLEKFEK